MATPRIKLPEIISAQAQKHVTHNDALFILDALVQGAVADRTTTTPPASPEDGDAYVVASPATGVWAGHENDLAVYEAAGWAFHTPLTGWLLYCAADGEHITFDGSDWLSFTDALPFLSSGGGTISGDLVVADGSPSLQLDTTAISGAQAFFRMTGARTSTSGVVAQIDYDNAGTGVEGTAAQWLIDGDGNVNLSVGTLQVNGQDVFHSGNLATGSDERRFGKIGIGGATPDATNPFAFYGENMLFNSGGSINAKFNKNAAGDDASMTFQSAFSTKALLGLLGDDNFTLKVGSGFHTAMIADETDGSVTFPNQKTFRQIRPFGGRWYCYTDNRWIGPGNYHTENKAVNLGTGADPNTDWDGKSDHFVKTGSVLHEIDIVWNFNSAEITDAYFKVYLKHADWASGDVNSTGEVTRVELTGGTLTPITAGTGMNRTVLDLGGYVVPEDGFIIMVMKPAGSITATRYVQVAGNIDMTIVA